MNRELTFTFRVRTLASGQPRPFADTRYLYEITSPLPPATVKKFCTSLLHPCKVECNPQHCPLVPYYRFERMDQDRYRYGVTFPYCD